MPKKIAKKKQNTKVVIRDEDDESSSEDEQIQKVSKDKTVKVSSADVGLQDYDDEDMDGFMS